MTNDEERELLDQAINSLMAGKKLEKLQRAAWNNLLREIKGGRALTPRQEDIVGLALAGPRRKSWASVVKGRFLDVAGKVDEFVLLLWLAFARAFGGPNAAPRNCELILSLLLNKSEQDPAIGDFLERYEQKRQRLGRRRADLWAYSDVLRTVWPVLRRKIGTLLKFAVAADWVRRQFHQ